jgi:catechol 2,3-dioxygenase-like lactoylglutathione lyase family enzyme
MPITQFLHVSIGVSDPEKSVPFYRDILGFKHLATLHYDQPGPAQVMGFKDADFTVWLMMRDGFRLELIHFNNPKSDPLPSRPRTNDLGLSHLTVGIEDPEKTMAELKARGVKVWEHTVGNFDQNAPGFMFLFEDPDGFLIECYMARPDGKFPYGNDSKVSSPRSQPRRQSGKARRQTANK